MIIRKVIIKLTLLWLLRPTFILLLSIALVEAANPLVTPAWLMENLNKSNLRVLDLQHPKGYQRAHLPGAVSSEYAKWRMMGRNGVPSVLPDKAYLESLIGGLGIDNTTHVLLAPLGAGASDMAVATRIYWTFKAMGHDEISILDGGLIAYSQLPGSRFVIDVPSPKTAVFKATVRTDYFPDANAVKQALEKGVTFVDSRSKQEFLGKVSGAKHERAGTIPGSIHLPYDQLIVDRSGKFHSKDRLQDIYIQRGVPLSGEQISFCHTGHRTSLSWFVSHELLGNKNAKMYDGSTAEWAASTDLPLVVLWKKDCRNQTC